MPEPIPAREATGSALRLETRLETSQTEDRPTNFPFVSIVIPTRERAETLYHTLRTCLEQEGDDYEVVVCDNCGSPATRAVVDGFASARIKYVRSAKPAVGNS